LNIDFFTSIGMHHSERVVLEKWIFGRHLMFSAIKLMLFGANDVSEVNAALRDSLLESIAKEERRACEKMADRDYWRIVGDLEMQAVAEIRAVLQEISEHLPPAQYRKRVVRALEGLAVQWRNNDEDEDGYGVATVHAVGKLLAEYLG
jgi:hypothetical protein